MKRAIVTYAEGAHEELLEISLPGFRDFAHRHGYELLIGNHTGKNSLPPAWLKLEFLRQALESHQEAVWFDADLIIVNPLDDLPALDYGWLHAMVRHFEGGSEVPNSGVWHLRRECMAGGPRAIDLLHKVSELEVFINHGWWEQAALLTLMGYTVPPEGSHFPDTKCRSVQKTKWYNCCRFLRLAWNSHPNYRSSTPRIVHCSYPAMTERIEVMRALVKDPHYQYPRYDAPKQQKDANDEF